MDGDEHHVASDRFMMRHVANRRPAHDATGVGYELSEHAASVVRDPEANEAEGDVVRLVAGADARHRPARSERRNGELAR